MSEQLEGPDGTVPNESRMFLLQADVRGDGSAAGILCIYGYEKVMHFTGIDQAFLMIHESLNREASQAGKVQLRTFKKREHCQSAMAGIPAADILAADQARGRRYRESFVIHIICRQNTSWQGEVSWNGQRLCFRSGLELMSLIWSGLERSAARTRGCVSSVRNLSEASGKIPREPLAVGG